MGAGADFFDTPDSIPPELELSSYPVAIIDLDYALPAKSLLQNWREAHRGMRIIGMSQHRFDPRRADIIGHDLFACIKKPVDPDELGQLLRDAVPGTSPHHPRAE